MCKQSGLFDHQNYIKKVSRNISMKEITSKKARGSKVDFSTIKITSKKVHGNDMDFSISKITSQKYMKMTWKFVEIWSSNGLHVISTSNRRRFDVECPLGSLIKPQPFPCASACGYLVRLNWQESKPDHKNFIEFSFSEPAASEPASREGLYLPCDSDANFGQLISALFLPKPLKA